MRRQAKIDLDGHGTPVFWAETDVDAFYGLGVIHGRHRPFQSLVLHAAGRGQLAASLWAKSELLRIDVLARRLGLPTRARSVADALSSFAVERVDAYLEGLISEAGRARFPLQHALTGASFRRPDRSSLVAGFMLSAYLGLAECQQRMERAVVDALVEGADPSLLETMFAPHLVGWRPEILKQLPRSFSDGLSRFSRFGGSNVFAVDGTRTKRGTAILAGDPHLQINQLPSLFIEVAGRVKNDYWLGATIPGLPGIAIGRNQHVAWSGTFAVADNVDHFVEDIEGDAFLEVDGSRQPVRDREEVIGRRFRSPLSVRFRETARGVLEDRESDGEHDNVRRLELATAWAGLGEVHEAIEAYLRLPSAESAAHGENILERAHTLSLHFILADKTVPGEIRYCQAGRIPERSNGWSGLYPASPRDGASWQGFYQGRKLPRCLADDGFLVSANEARPATNGGVLSTLAQPDYRYNRMSACLAASRDHDVESVKRLQLDLFSPQARALSPLFIEHLPEGAILRALTEWTHTYEPESLGAHAFSLAYQEAIRALEPDLGGDWFSSTMKASELPVWWCNAIDRLLTTPEVWTEPRTTRLRKNLARVANEELAPWGEVQRLELTNMVLGGAPRWLQVDRGPFPLPGSIATVRQGNIVRFPWGKVAVGPAYRFVTDLGTDEAFTALPGGTDGTPWSPFYAQWLDEYLENRYHRLAPP